MHTMRLPVLHFLFALRQPLWKPRVSQGTMEKRQAFLREKTLNIQARQKRNSLRHCLHQRTIKCLLVFDVHNRKNMCYPQFTSETPAIILLGPPSFGFFSSIKAGKNVMSTSVDIALNIIITAVRFGIIYNLLRTII
jgi:hypothetical protein